MVEGSFRYISSYLTVDSQLKGHRFAGFLGSSFYNMPVHMHEISYLVSKLSSLIWAEVEMTPII